MGTLLFPLVLLAVRSKSFHSIGAPSLSSFLPRVLSLYSSLSSSIFNFRGLYLGSTRSAFLIPYTLLPFYFFSHVTEIKSEK